MDRFEVERLGHLVEYSRSRAGVHSKAWITFWLSAILGTMVVAVISHAPTAAYAVLVLVAVVMLAVEVRPGKR